MNLDQGERRKRLDKMVFLNPSNNRWTCHICNVSFTQKVTATNHIEAQHLRILAYPCSFCNTRFTSSGARRTHVHANHREQNKMSKFLID